MDKEQTLEFLIMLLEDVEKDEGILAMAEDLLERLEANNARIVLDES